MKATTLFRAFVPLLFSGLCSADVGAQTVNTDSLLAILVATDTPDTIFAATAEELSYAYVYNDPERSLGYARQGLRVARRIGHSNLVRINAMAVGNGLYALGQLDSAVHYYEENLRHSLTPERKTASYNMIASVRAKQKRFTDADTLFTAAYTIAREVNDTARQIQLLTNMAFMAHEQGRPQLAIQRILTGLALEPTDPFVKIALYNNLCSTCSDNGLYERSITYCKQASAIANGLAQGNMAATPLSNLALSFNMIGELDSALYYYALADAIESLPVTQVYILNGVAEVYRKKGQQGKVLKALEKACQLASADENMGSELAYTNTLLGQYYLDEENFATAETYLRQANQLLEAIDSDAIQEIDTKKLLFTTLSARGKVVPPIMLGRYFKLRDSLHSNQKLKDLNEITERYELAKARAANAELDLARVSSDLRAIRNKNLLWGAVLLLGLLSIGVLILNQLRQREKKMAADLIKSNAQITTLYDDLYHRTNNNLSRMINLLERQKSDAGRNGLAAEPLRAIERQIWVFTLLQRLLGKQTGGRINLRNYLDELTTALEKSTADQKEVLDVELTCPDQEVNSDFATNIGLVVNELVTNSLKYARGVGEEIPVELKVVSIAPTRLEIAYRDAGPRPEARNHYSTGGGRQLIEQLVQQLKGEEVETAADNYRFRTVFPV